MADNPSKDRGRETSTATPPRSASSQPGGLSRRQPSSLSRSPFTTIFQRWNDEMDRFFEDFGLPSLVLTAVSGGRAEFALDIASDQVHRE